jgi:hypothetical protein
MLTLRRRAIPHVIALGLLLAAASGACAQTHWPSLFRYTVSLSTDNAATYQVSASLSGPLGQDFEAKVEGWWIANDDDREFLGDTYLAYNRAPVYLAAGRKYVPFGPAGVLVSPGIEGGELRLAIGGATLQAITGSLAFTPGVGTTRYTFSGARATEDEDITAVRLGGTLTPADSQNPVALGVNWVDLRDDDGESADISIGVNPWLTLYAEYADFDADAYVYGVRLSDADLRSDGKAWILVLYMRDIEVGFVPAEIGASVYFEGQDGLVGALYYQMAPQYAVGVYADEEEAILTWFHSIPL